MFQREITVKLRSYAEKYRAIAMIGPRQSGKTTLSRACFSDYEYYSLENPDIRTRAKEDPKGFLSSIRSNCILDEVQHTPDIFSYLQGILDDPLDKRRFIVTGSNGFQLNEKISQSLAGRIRILTILCLQRSEIPAHLQPKGINNSLWQGCFPRIFNEGLHAAEWYAEYYNTYIQKDLRDLLRIDNLTLFDKFVRICAGRTAQLCNFSSIATEVGISQPTAIKWASVMEASFLLFRLEPHFKNFNKRLTKSPKLFFCDTGLVCFMLRITPPEQLESHPLRGAIFETWVVNEMIKTYRNRAEEPPLYFWRDQHGHEVDIIIDKSTHLHPIEVKSAETIRPEWLQNADWLNKLQGHSLSTLIYGGNDSFVFKNCEVRSWKDIVTV